MIIASHDDEIPEREMIIVDETAGASGDTFSAVSYNILCDRYAKVAQYGYVPEHFLSWDYRKTKIFEEVETYDADIICLQELDKTNHDEHFKPNFSKLGYKCFYHQKGRHETMGSDAKYVDGCGTFWKDKKYLVLDQQYFVLGRKAVEGSAIKTTDLINRVWQRDDIATVVLLENRLTGSRLIVANAHFYWDPAFKDVKLVQMAVLLEQLSALSQKYAAMGPCQSKRRSHLTLADDAEPDPEPGPSLEYAEGTQIPMIICGDFNSAVNSEAYGLFANGRLEKHHDDFNGRDYGQYTNSKVTHPFTLRSAYGSVGELKFTNYTPTFTDVLDYIWYSSNSVRVTGVLGGVDEEYLRRVPGFPNSDFPSDHLLLKADFSINKQKTNKVVEADFGPQSNRR